LSKANRLYVLDATALYAGIHGLEKAYTTPQVLREVFGSRLRRFIIEEMIRKQRLNVQEAAFKHVKAVRQAAQSTGDIDMLSEADLHVLALSLQLKEEHGDVQVLSDDYAVQNVCAQLGLSYSSSMTKGIAKQIVWEWFCPGCEVSYPNLKGGVCPACASQLKRRPSELHNAKRYE
jgi:UPF0271 protein